jgi:hypothetical protein
MEMVYGDLTKQALHRLAFLLAALIALVGSCSPVSAASASQSDVSNAQVRPCKVSESPQPPKTAPSRHKKPQETKPSDSSSSCLEIHAGVLQVQEYLQAWIRDLHWKLNDENTNENSWDFSTKLSPDDLLKFTKPDRRPNGIEWQSGSVSIQITTSDIDSGYSRTVIRATFRGIGENKDKLATPHDWYPLDSNGSLENSFVEALTKHFSGANH